MRSLVLKTLILTAFLLGIAFHAEAQGTNLTLVVTTIDGVEQAYQMTEESQLYFQDGENLVIQDGAGNSETYPLSQIRKIVCSEITGTAENAMTNLGLFPNPTRNSFIIKNIQDAQPARIYALDGRLMKTFVATEGMPVDISELASGMYLLHINGQTLKLMKL